MRILFLAPQPFYVERGTPIAVRQAVTSLAKSGHSVDLVTFHEGQDIAIDGVVHHRIRRPALVRSVPVGLSPAKLICDAALARAAMKLMRRQTFDVVHAVEESVFLALPMKAKQGAKLVYDMDSIMSDQIVEKWPAAKLLRPFLWALECAAIRRADLVLPVCDAIAERIHDAAADRTHVLPDVAPTQGEVSADVEDLRSSLGITSPLVLYVGNLEGYQGIDLLLESAACCKEAHHLVIIGGAPAAVEKYKAEATSLGVSKRVSFLGARPLKDLTAYLRQADVLCSPRLKGLNTPMKLYAYMASGRPIVATDILSHTQVLSDRTAMLCKPFATELSEGLRRILIDPGLGSRLAAQAKALVDERYSLANFEHRLATAYATLERAPS